MKNRRKLFTALVFVALVFAIMAANALSVSALTTSDGFAYSVNSGGNTVTITGYSGSRTKINIPSEIDGKKVTDIGAYAFSLGETYDETTTEITIPNTVKYIGSYAFYNLRAITEVVIPDSVITVDDGAFHKCINVKRLYIGSKVGYIGNNGVSRMQVLETIDIANENKLFKLEGGCLIDVARTKVITTLDRSDLTIPKGITEIGDCAFYLRKKLTSIVIPDGVGIIGENAFDGTPLTKLVLPKTVNTIEYAAFANGGNALRTGHVYYEGSSFDSVMIYTANNNLLLCSNIHYNACMVSPNYAHYYGGGISDTVCDYCNKAKLSLFNYVLNPDGVTLKITGYVGGNSQIVIPSEIDGRKVTSIGDYAFSKGETYDFTITDITIPDTVNTIGAYAFYNLRALTEIVIPDSVTTIGEGAFHKCISVKKLTIGANLTRAGDRALVRMHALTEVVISPENTAFKLEGGCLIDVAKKEVLTTLDIKDITIPSWVTRIGDCSFYLRQYIQKIVIPTGVTYIGECAFDGSSVAVVVIPKTVKTIVNAAFANTDKLSNPGGHVYYEGTEADYAAIDWWVCCAGTTQNNNIIMATRATKHFNACMEADDYTHSYSGGCDTTCNECYKETRAMVSDHVYSDWVKNDATQHWKVCACGKKSDVGNHVFNNNTCTTCGYVVGTVHVYSNEWYSDGINHWHICTKCGTEKSEQGAHVGGTATCQSKRICTVCGQAYGELGACVYASVVDEAYLVKRATCSSKAVYKISCTVCKKAHETETFENGDFDSESHDYGKYESDANEHWPKCQCGKEGEKAAHTYGDWTITKESTENEKGTKEKSCSVCGYKITEDIDQVVKGEEQKSSSYVLWIIIAIAVGITSSCITFLITSRKK